MINKDRTMSINAYGRRTISELQIIKTAALDAVTLNAVRNGETL